VPCLKAWGDSLGGINYPLLSDFYPHGEIAQRYGVLRDDGKSERAIFVVDKNGVIRYVDVHDIDDQPDNEILFRELAAIEGVPVPPPIVRDDAPGQETEAASSPVEMNVIMYCTAWCPACRRARGFFRANNIPFTEVDITRDREAAERVRRFANGNEITPSFEINGEFIVNFQRTRLMEIFGIQESV
jgi:glutaredoxin